MCKSAKVQLWSHHAITVAPYEGSLQVDGNRRRVQLPGLTLSEQSSVAGFGECRGDVEVRATLIAADGGSVGSARRNFVRGMQ